MSLIVSSDGFAANKSVTVTYDGSQEGTAATNDKGSFSGVSFSAPKGIHGNHEVTPTDAANNTDTTTFVMESDAPAKPELTTPANGRRIGFIGKVAPRFEWLAMMDPSGVTYSLQVSSDESFANLVIPEVSAYYWRVKAIDGAQNDSGWTIPYSFRSVSCLYGRLFLLSLQ